MNFESQEKHLLKMLLLLKIAALLTVFLTCVQSEIFQGSREALWDLLIEKLEAIQKEEDLLWNTGKLNYL